MIDNLSKPSNSGIVIRNLAKTFQSNKTDVVALEDVDLDIKENEFLCIVGPSGCGKTTLLRILAGLDHQTQGTVVTNIKNQTRPLQSMVFQEQGVFPWLTVLENAAYGLAARNVSKNSRNEKALIFINKLGLTGFEDAYPHQLSGGMRQRVNLARAFANDPSILLMDEPLGSLDEQTKMLVQKDLLNLWEGSDRTVVFITHSIDEAIVLGDRIAVMSNRPGKIKTIIPNNLKRPRDTLELRNDEKFIEIRKETWDALKTEVTSFS